MNYFYSLINEEIRKCKEEEIKKISDNTLYHYTGIGGLKGIADKWQLRMTEIAYLNDRKEYTDSFSILEDLYDCKFKCSDKYRDIFSLALKDSKNIEDIALFESKFDKVFVFSLSTKKDDLNQWRSYATRGGYSIGFNFSALDHMSKLYQYGELYLLPCIYDNSSKMSIVENIINKILEDFDLYPLFGDNLKKKIEHHAFLIRNEIMKLAPIFKSKYFHEEAEWRLIYIENNQALWFQSFERGNLLVPCFFVDLPLKINDEFPIKRIHIGPLPKSEKMLAYQSTFNFIRAIPHMLQKKDDSNHSINFEGFEILSNNICLSEIPFRDNY
jgi:hypothetical protein